MKPASGDDKKPAPAHEPHERDFYLDELMTAQPEATQEYFRARLRASAKAPKRED
ncbi:MAG TPA: hypothetical protein VG841_12965 [Caulobacterales bacterium]|nr:hypothetical protein [Caulobacterales bacterium]